jgi:hypothetical protein
MRNAAMGSWGHRGLRTVAACVAAFAVAACDMFAPMLPSDAEQFVPPPVYSTWWKMASACSGSKASLESVTWFKTAQPLTDPRTGQSIAGYWSSGSNRIVLRDNVMFQGGTVRHEMLHSLLGRGGHPRDQFLGNCLGTVDCQGSCIHDAGNYPKPPTTPIHVTSDSISITVDVNPRQPSTLIDDGFFSVIVSVSNVSKHWVTVPSFLSTIFPERTDSSHTFMFIMQGVTGGLQGGELRFDPSEWIFAPGETKKQIFDFVIGSDLFNAEPPPGAYTVHGGYSHYWSAPMTFVISQ